MLNLLARQVINRYQGLKIIKEVLSKEKKLDKLIEEVEKQAYRATYDIVKATFPLPNVMLIEDETEPSTNRVGFFPEQDADYRISLRDEILDYYGRIPRKTFIRWDNTGEAIAVLQYMLEYNTCNKEVFNYDTFWVDIFWLGCLIEEVHLHPIQES